MGFYSLNILRAGTDPNPARLHRLYRRKTLLALALTIAVAALHGRHLPVVRLAFIQWLEWGQLPDRLSARMC